MGSALPENWPVMSIQAANAAIASSETELKLADANINGVDMKVYVDAPKTLRDILVAADTQYPDRDYLVFEGERVTFSGFNRAVEHFAHALVNDFGVQKGDRVAIIMRNYPEWAVAFFAGLSIGAIVTPMNSWWTGDELDYGLSDSGSKIAVIDADILGRIQSRLDGLSELEKVFVIGAAGDAVNDRILALADIIGPISNWSSLPAIGLPDIELEPEDDATIMYTSG
ncbi:MAG: AMP-binding protein, partial [Henriciella sp.]